MEAKRQKSFIKTPKQELESQIKTQKIFTDIMFNDIQEWNIMPSQQEEQIKEFKKQKSLLIVLVKKYNLLYR